MIQNANKSQKNQNIAIGFWTKGFFNEQTNSIHPDKLEALESNIHKKVAVAHYFRGWEHLENENEIGVELQTISTKGWVPMVSVNPYFFGKCESDNGETLYKTISTGKCDAFLKGAGAVLADVQSPFLLRFAWEMNVDSMEWSIQRTGSTPQEFKLAWQRVHSIFKSSGVKNAYWVFSPQVTSPTTIPIADLYPGDAYVDWVGLDGYNWGTTQSWSTWQSFSEIFKESYNEMRAIAPSKKFMIAEVNTVDAGGNQAEWYAKMLHDEIPKDFKDIDAIIFFEDDKIEQEKVKWFIDTTPESLDAFRKGIELDIYKTSININ